MIVMQILLLYVALTNRALPNASIDLANPFASSKDNGPRPYNFWQWRSARPYWQFLLYFTIVLCVLQVLVGRNLRLLLIFRA